MTKYHISPKTGRPNVCRATKRACPISGDEQHYNSKEEAQEAFEQNMRNSEVPKILKGKRDRNLSHLISVEKKEMENKWDEIVKLDKSIRESKESMMKSHRALTHIESARECFNDYNKVLESSDDSEPSKEILLKRHLGRAVRAMESSKRPYLPYHQETYPSKSYPTPESVKRDIDQADAKEAKAANEAIDEIQDYQSRKKELKESVIAKTGYSENPKFGIPDTMTTDQKYANKRASNYSTLPQKDVQVLKDAEKFCQNCSETLVYNDTGYRHKSGGYKCDSGETNLSMNPTCPYCGTGDPAHNSFAQRSYSDESHCSRCEGISGYAIGD